MRRVLKSLVLLLTVSSCALAQQSGNNPPIQIHPINSSDYTDPSQFSFLQPILKDVEVVSLGESIHFTHEFPLVRFGIVRYLNENMGFHVVAMEGSAEDVWVAQDRFLNSARAIADAQDAQKGLFLIWTTPEVRQMFRYESSSWNSPNPFYIAAYDIQPGSGSGSHGAEVFRLLIERLRLYASPPEHFDADKWVNDLAPLTGSCSDYQPSDQSRVDAAIQSLESWTDRAAQEVEKRFPNVPHGAVLRLIPSNLRASLKLCQDLGKLDWGRYKGLRDTNAAQFALQLKNVVPNQKLILWAHVSHIFHNDEHIAVSVGEVLHRTLGPRLYTIAPFAQGGGTIILFNDTKDDIGYGWVHGNQSDLEKRLSSLSDQDYFLDLRQSNESLQADPLFTTKQSLWVEMEHWPITLTHDFDGIIRIKTIRSPNLPLSEFLFLSSLHYETHLIVLGIILILGIILLIVRYLVRRSRRRASKR